MSRRKTTITKEVTMADIIKTWGGPDKLIQAGLVALIREGQRRRDYEQLSPGEQAMVDMVEEIADRLCRHSPGYVSGILEGLRKMQDREKLYSGHVAEITADVLDGIKDRAVGKVGSVTDQQPQLV